MPSLDLLAGRLELLLPVVMRALSLPPEEDPLADLTPAQLRFVRALEPGDRSLSDLAPRLQMSLSAATQLAQRLEDAGLIVRGCDGDDRRIKPIGLSPEGRRRLEVRRGLRIKVAKRLLARLDSETRHRVIESLELLADSVETPASLKMTESGF